MALFTKVSGSNATTTGQSLVDIPGLSVALEADMVYEIEATLICSTSTVTTGIGVGINLTSTSGASIEAVAFGSTTASAMRAIRISAFNTSAQAFLTASGITGTIMIKGLVKTGTTAPTLTIKHLKVTSGTSTIFLNSFLKIRRAY